MKLDEVASKAGGFGLILAAGDQSIDASDWHGMTDVYTSKSAFLKAVKDQYLEHAQQMTDEDDEEGQLDLSKVKAAKTLADLAMTEHWDSFIDHVWIDDRF